MRAPMNPSPTSEQMLNNCCKTRVLMLHPGTPHPVESNLFGSSILNQIASINALMNYAIANRKINTIMSEVKKRCDDWNEHHDGFSRLIYGL